MKKILFLLNLFIFLNITDCFSSDNHNVNQSDVEALLYLGAMGLGSISAKLMHDNLLYKFKWPVNFSLGFLALIASSKIGQNRSETKVDNKKINIKNCIINLFKDKNFISTFRAFVGAGFSVYLMAAGCENTIYFGPEISKQNNLDLWKSLKLDMNDMQNL